METLEVTSADGTRIGCEVFGTGPPLLAIHGSAADRSRWAAVRDGLAARYRVHLMDRRGRGLSAAEAEGDYGLEREAENIRALLAAIVPAFVLAHSYGATCALAAGGPGILRLLAYEPAFGTAAGDVFPADALPQVDAALARGDREAALEIFLRRALRLDDSAIAALRGGELWQARLAAVHTLAREGRAANAYRPPAPAPLGPSLRLLLGSESPPTLQASTRAVHAAAPGSELRALPGHAHAAMDADPALFVAEVADWLVSG